MKRVIGLLVGIITVLTLPESASAHGGGPESVVSFGGIVNWLHFVATALWLGGIVFLRFVVAPSLVERGPQRRRLMEAVTIRFTHLVWWCIGGLAFTGILTTWVHVPSPQTVTTSAYGLILILKTAIAVGLVLCNLIIGFGLARRARRNAGEASGSAPAVSYWNPVRWVVPASRASLILAFSMMVAVAALTEFDRSPWTIGLNFLRLSTLTIWLGATAFVPLVLGPSLVGVDKTYLVHINGRILRRFGGLAAGCAMAAVVATAITLAKNVETVSHLWETGYGITKVLELAVLTVMAMVSWRSALRAEFGSSRQTGSGIPLVRLATAKTMRRAIEASAANLVMGLAALLLSSLGGALYSPGEPALSNQIPTAAATVSADWIEPLGYVVAAGVAVAVIWYFGVVEGKVAKHEAQEESS